MIKVKTRRTLEDIDRYFSPQEVYDLIAKAKMPEAYPTAKSMARNRAFMALLYLTGGRISEVLSLHKNQFIESKKLITIKDMIVVKHRTNPKTGQKIFRGPPIRAEVWLPKSGTLSPFTELTIGYLKYLGPTEKLFVFTRWHGHRIIKKMTGKWPHWFRAQIESYLGPIMDKDLAKYMHVSQASTEPYLIARLDQYKRKLLR